MNSHAIKAVLVVTATLSAVLLAAIVATGGISAFANPYHWLPVIMCVTAIWGAVAASKKTSN